MTTLVFHDRGWLVVTAAWSVAQKVGKNKAARIVYTWGADGIGWTDQATGDAACDLPMTVEVFLDKLQRNPGAILDLRPFQQAA